MKRALHLLLLLGALIGLLGVEAAYAVGPQAMVAPSAASQMDQMDADCMEMMREQPEPAPMPCKGMTLDCIAAMGCIVPVLVRGEHAALATPRTTSVEAFWPATTVLVGSDLPPEQHPPTRLG